MKRRKRLTFWSANEDDDSLVRNVIAGKKTATASVRANTVFLTVSMGTAVTKLVTSSRCMTRSSVYDAQLKL